MQVLFPRYSVFLFMLFIVFHLYNFFPIMPKNFLTHRSFSVGESGPPSLLLHSKITKEKHNAPVNKENNRGIEPQLRHQPYFTFKYPE